MKIHRYLIAFVASVLTSSAWAQPAPQTLNLTLPPGSVTASSFAAPAKDADKTAATATTTAATTMITTTVTQALQPTAQSNAQYDADANAAVDAADAAGASVDTADSSRMRPASCDDATYNQAQVHGSLGMGVVGGNHISGNYQTGNVNISKATGSCDHPTGGVSLSISVGQGNFNGGNFGRRRW
ncbi:MAG: hypothetical protein JSS42_16215 [Proteobacteria bacterium]|uniref:hypothetical protein n=1 Tax=Rudaea sp. TaxID=2136325 RepID=UPI00321F9E84|nr:hypothetical protein [Pseudomonadota bacterium]